MARWLLLLIAAMLLVVAACEADDPEETEDVTDVEEPEPPEADEPEPEEPQEESREDAEPEEVAELVSEIAEQVEDLRGLEVHEEISTSVVDQEELVNIVVDEERDEEDQALRQTRQDVLIALRFLPPDVDLDEVTAQLVEGGVAGLYDPEEGEAYISSEEWPLGPSAQVTTAHEIVHALQDQSFDLTRLGDLERDSPDSAMAFRSVVEGDAVLTQEDWASAHLSDEEQQERTQEEQEAAAQAQEALATLPPYVVFEQLIPYELGEQFLRAVVEEEAGEEQDAEQAIDARLQDPPSTTVELYDPTLHLDGFEPAAIEATASPGDEWEALDEFGFGAYLVNAYFFLADSLAEGSAATALWRGGQLQAWSGPDGIAVGVAVGFSDDGAERFCAVVPALHTDGDDAEEVGGGRYETDRDALAVDCSSDEVRFASAPTLEVAERMLDG